MDLRRFKLNQARVQAATRLFDYQPFRLSDDLLTGVGHSWLYATDLESLHRPQMVFDRANEIDLWTKAEAANARLRRSYEMFADTIAATCPGGSYLDLCCNSGYMPVAASLRGMKECIGADAGDFSGHIAWLNAVTGSRASFLRAEYQPQHHRLALHVDRPVDIVSSMAFLFHVPDPLHFLKCVAALAGHAILLWSSFTRDDQLVIRYPQRANQFADTPFPWNFDAGTTISDGLLRFAMQQLGFSREREVIVANGWPEEWDNPLMKPYQPMRAFLFTK